MKAPAVVFLFALLSAALCAEERLIPLDEFYISVPLTKGANPKGLKVDVWMHRPMREPMDETVPYEQRHGAFLLGDAGTDVQCPTIPFSEKMLLPDDQAAVMEACAAAVKGQEYHKETERKFRQAEWNYKTVYEVVTVEGQKRVRIGRSGVDGGGDAFLDPAEGARLKEVLVKAAAAVAWYKLLLTSRTLPEKTAEARPPKATGYGMGCPLSGIYGERMTYGFTLQMRSYTKEPTFDIDYNLAFAVMQGNHKVDSGIGGKLAGHLMEQVALALEAAEKKKAFTFGSPADVKDFKYTITANLAAQRADVAFDILNLDGSHALVKGSFAVAQLAQFRAVEAQKAARAKWFVEHEEWFFERE